MEPPAPPPPPPPAGGKPAAAAAAPAAAPTHDVFGDAPLGLAMLLLVALQAMSMLLRPPSAC